MSRVYSFTHRWRVDAPRDVVFDVLRDGEGYPRWWPQFRRAVALDASSGVAEIRGALPYRLRLVVTREVEDRAAGILRVTLSGGLRGYAEFSIPGAPPRPGDPLVLSYRQEVVVTARGLRSLAPILGPILRANHAAMMRSGEQGLRKACSEACSAES